jgi:hypothetical protein
MVAYCIVDLLFLMGHWEYCWGIYSRSYVIEKVLGLRQDEPKLYIINVIVQGLIVSSFFVCSVVSIVYAAYYPGYDWSVTA